MSTDSSLPRFDRPPVNEVALSAQFEPLASMSAAHLGLAWTAFRNRFPKVEQHPPIPHVVERKGLRSAPTTPQLELVTSEQTPRLWMLDETGCELIQIQPDRFVRNWRRRGDVVLYPHYDEHLRPSFIRDFELFQRFVQDENLGEIKVDQCEVTYVNLILPEGVWEHHGQADRVFRGWSKSFCEAVEGLDAEAVGIRTRHVIKNSAGEFVGRLFVEIDSAFKADEAKALVPIFKMQLVARGRPLGDGLAGVMAFLDVSRKAIVCSFTNLTTEKMHKVWGRSV